MNSRMKRLYRKLRLRFHYRNAFVFTPRARRLVVRDDLYEYVDRWHIPHFMSFEDRRKNEFFLVPDPETEKTTVMLPDEFQSLVGRHRT